MSLATSNQLQSALMTLMKKILALPSSAKTLRLHIDTGISCMHHMKRIDSPHWINCKLHVPETNQHALIECEKHKSIRDEYMIQIHEIIRSQQITLPMLLWSDTWNILHDKQMLLRNITGKYINEIMKNRMEYVPFMI